ncbi:hypothetical protein AWN76_009065 [Rhodothermaceae bacterium RA]|nr:hypothetical protein AWN76_009065 [Rhodothermaceae bacterium RA]
MHLTRYLERLDRRAAALQQQSLRYSRVRLALVLGTAVLAFALGQTAGPPAGWAVALAGIVAFLLVARRHARLEDGLTRLRRWRRLKATHLARLHLDWEALPPPADTAPDPAHPFAADLTLIGPRSLHHLLDTTASRVAANASGPGSPPPSPTSTRRAAASGSSGRWPRTPASATSWRSTAR